ncbi:Ig-like domain-containing protein [Candidatus Pristimantibacillus sp. PTI5]|uniref:Ig-like domain-containing protein n=1 Tax=Candidatus Pristimantibacillus sp. PTI5 TaxID=3400422 RepID=UPI003B01B28C
MKKKFKKPGYKLSKKLSLSLLSTAVLVAPLSVSSHVYASNPTILQPITITDYAQNYTMNGSAINLDISSRLAPLDQGSVQVIVSSSKPAIADVTAAGSLLTLNTQAAGSTVITVHASDKHGKAMIDSFQFQVTKIGDTTGDGLVTPADALYIYKVVNTKTPLSVEEKNRLDINRDGVVTSADATMLVNTYVGKTTAAQTFIIAISDINDAPVASNNEGIEDSLSDGSTVTGTYIYLDAEGDPEGSSQYQWYIGSQQEGSDKTKILGATGSEYTVTAADANRYLFFEVTPIAANGNQQGIPTIAAVSSLIPDTTAPTGTVTINESAAATNAENVMLTTTSSDGAGISGTEMRFSNDGVIWSSWETAAASRSWTLQSGDGLKTVFMQLRDGAGNATANSFSDTITLDTAAPAGTLNINNGKATTAEANVNLDITSTDAAGVNGIEMRFSNDGSSWTDWETAAASKSWTLPAGEGLKNVSMQLRDRLHNVTTTAITHSIVVDATPPAGMLSINNDALAVGSVHAILSITSSDSNGNVEMRFSNDGSNWSSWEAASASKSWTLDASEGKKSVSMQLRDSAGNVTASDISDDILLDLTAPSGSLIINSNAASVKAAEVTLSITNTDDTVVGGTKMRFSNDGVNWSTWEDTAATKQWSLTSGDGAKTVWLELQDGLGNTTGNPISDSIMLDGTAPTGTLNINHGDVVTASASVELNVTSTDGSGVAGTEMRFSNDGSSWSDWEAAASNKSWSLTADDGEKTVYMQLRDSLGNVMANTVSDMISLDTTGPRITVSTPANGGYNIPAEGSFSLTFDENISETAGKNITLRALTDDHIIETYDVSNSNQVTISGSTVTFSHTTLGQLTDYYLEIDAGAFADAAGNAFIGLTGNSALRFTSQDSRALAVTLTEPLTETNLEGALITLDLTGDTFNPLAEAADFQLNNAPSGLSIIGAGVDSEKPSQAFVFLEFDQTNFDADITNFTITAKASALASGHAIASEAKTITAVIEGPVITAMSPANHALNSSLSADFSLTFSSPVTPVNGKYITVYEKFNGRTVQTINAGDTQKVAVNGNTLSIRHNILPGSIEYGIQVEPGAFQDLNGRPFTGITDSSAWTFTTRPAEVSPYFSDLIWGNDGRIALQLMYPGNGDPNHVATGYSIDVYKYMNQSKNIQVTNLPIGGINSYQPFIMINEIFYDAFDIANIIYYNNDDLSLYNPNAFTVTALVLKKDGITVDVLGNPSVTSAVPIIGEGKALIRRKGIIGGYNSFDLSEWNVFSSGIYSYMGSHRLFD